MSKRNTNPINYIKAYNQGADDWRKGIKKCSYKSKSTVRCWAAGWLGADIHTFVLPAGDEIIVGPDYILHGDGGIMLSDDKLAELDRNIAIHTQVVELNTRGTHLTLGEGLKELNEFLKRA